jgi:hypothetical protein
MSKKYIPMFRIAFVMVFLCGMWMQTSAGPQANQVSATPANQGSSTPANQVSATPANQGSSTPANQVSSTPSNQGSSTPAPRDAGAAIRDAGPAARGAGPPAGDNDSVKFTPKEAAAYLQKLVDNEELWWDTGDTARYSFGRLADHFREPFDSVRVRLLGFPYHLITPYPASLAMRDTLPVRWLTNKQFIVDTVPLMQDPMVYRQTLIVRTLDGFPNLYGDELPGLPADSLPEYFRKSLQAFYGDSLPELESLLRHILQVKDTVTTAFVDTAYLEARGVTLHRVQNGRVQPPLLPAGSRKTVDFLPDSSHIVVSEFRRVMAAGSDSPFYMVPDEQTPDSLRMAVETLLKHTYERDSILLYLSDLEGRRTPFWLTSGKDDLVRYWVKNAENDSITIWMGNPSKFDLTLVLEDDLLVERMEKRPADAIPITTIRPERTLATVKPLEEVPIYWDFGFVSSFSLNQNHLSNWSRGGESSLAGLLDVNTSARYTNKASKTRWTNSGRLRYGSIWTKERGTRTSTDIIELNSQFNRELREKLAFSTVFYGKTQLAEGFNYPNDSVPVSRFLNPGAFTIGVGVEFEPFKKTLINLSPLSYRNTFVLDTLNINQTAHGIDADKRARQEGGGQLVFRNTLTIMEGMDLTNRVRLFSNYLDKPQNVDVDWEMTLNMQINWFFTIRLNLHVIYDDDIRFPVVDESGQPVLLPDGTQMKGPRTQLNQFFGLTLSFKI